MRITLDYTITALFIRNQGVPINRPVFMVSPKQMTLFSFFNKVSFPKTKYKIISVLFLCFFFSDRVFHSRYKKNAHISPKNKQINKKSQRTRTANTQDEKQKRNKHAHTYISIHRLSSNKKKEENRRREINITEVFG